MRKSLVIATAIFYVEVQEILQVIHMLISMKVITVHVLELDGISLGKHHLHIGKLKQFSQLIVFPCKMSKSYNRHKSDTFHDKPRSGMVYLTESVYSPVIPGLVTRHNNTILIIDVRLLKTVKSKWYYKGHYA